MKIIYFLQNSCDFKAFVDHLNSSNLLLQPSLNHTTHYSISEYDCDKCSTYYIAPENNLNQIDNPDISSMASGSIKFVSSYKIDSYWELGRIVLTTPCSKTDSEVYRNIVKYIKKNYILSDDKMFYVGVNMYSDWMNYEVDCLSLFSYQKVTVDSTNFNFNHFRDYISNQGYTVKGNGLDIRRPLDESIADGYVIFSDECNVITRIAARKEYYTCNSQCIFLRKKRDKYTFIIDKRLLSPPFAPIENLYNMINNFLESIKQS